MKSIIIKTSEIKSESIEHIMDEIASDCDLMEKVRLIAYDCNWGIADAVEAIASHIAINDEDYVHVIGAWK
jgi:hypothetical protein